MCTSFSTAWRAVSSGVWNSGPMSTSKPEVGERRGDDLLAAVVAVLTHLGDRGCAGGGLRLLERVGHGACAP
jgi:hypothetical protein